MKKVVIAIFLLVLIVIIGSFGYVVIEKWDFFDSLYMTIITIGTVGFHEVGELSRIGRLFTIGLIIFGIGFGGYAFAILAAFIIEGDIRNLLRGRKMEKQLSKLKKHIIVCGYGKTGSEIIEEFRKFNKPFVVIENDSHRVNELKGQGWLVLEGDATEDETLEKAGVKAAEGLIATLPEDADNVYIVLTARGMNPKLRIIARAIDDVSSRKLLRAGADKVVSPYSIAGKRMARLILSPGIVDFLEVMALSQELELKVEEIPVKKSSPIANKRLNESNIKAETDGATIIGIRDTAGKIIVNPPGDTVLKEGLILYALGNSAQIEKLKKIT